MGEQPQNNERPNPLAVNIEGMNEAEKNLAFSEPYARNDWHKFNIDKVPRKKDDGQPKFVREEDPLTEREAQGYNEQSLQRKVVKHKNRKKAA